MKTLFFGDSFSEIFTIVKNPDIKSFVFPGSTLKGITKPYNKIRLKIIEEIKNDDDVNLVLLFGYIDIFQSFYYVTLEERKDFNIDKEIIEYVEFVNRLKIKGKKIIVIPYPSVVKAEFVLETLKIYNVISNMKIIEKDFNSEYLKNIFSHEFRINILNNFAKKIKKAIKDVNSSNNLETKIIFKNINKKILNNNNIKNEFIDKSEYNVHLRWGPLLKIYMKDKIFNSIGIREKYLNDLDKEEEKYEKKKEENLENISKYDKNIILKKRKDFRIFYVNQKEILVNEESKKIGIIIYSKNENNRLKKFITYFNSIDFFTKNNFYFFFVIKKDKEEIKTGFLMNIGAKIAIKEGCSSLIFHDVNFLPNSLLFPYYIAFPKIPIHIWCSNTKNKWSPFIGNVLNISTKDFIKINGFSNDLEGILLNDSFANRLIKNKIFAIIRPNLDKCFISENKVKEIDQSIIYNLEMIDLLEKDEENSMNKDFRNLLYISESKEIYRRFLLIHIEKL